MANARSQNVLKRQLTSEQTFINEWDSCGVYTSPSCRVAETC